MNAYNKAKLQRAFNFIEKMQEEEISKLEKQCKNLQKNFDKEELKSFVEGLEILQKGKNLNDAEYTQTLREYVKILRNKLEMKIYKEQREIQELNKKLDSFINKNSWVINGE